MMMSTMLTPQAKRPSTYGENTMVSTQSQTVVLADLEAGVSKVRQPSIAIGKTSKQDINILTHQPRNKRFMIS
jgi:hypothetical protein